MQLTVVSFYTANWEYPTHAARLARECESLGLAHHIVELPDTGSWLKNTRLKSKFIWETINELKSPILWIDVDGSIVKLPDQIDSSVDFAARLKPSGASRIWHVGTMFFNWTPKSIELVSRWNDCADAGSDELAFENVWREGWDGRYQNLPETYFRIQHRNKPVPSDTVIFHRLSQDSSKKQFFKKSRPFGRKMSDRASRNRDRAELMKSKSITNPPDDSGSMS